MVGPSFPTESDDQSGGSISRPEAWTRLLENTIQAEILPRLLSPPAVAPASGEHGGDACLTEADVQAFVRLILANDQPAARGVVQRIMASQGGREALNRQLLTPAARHLGWLWERDICDFMDVTLGVYRLDRLMKESEFADGQPATMHRHQHQALLLPAPGEQHCFGITMVAEVFRAGGWCVRTGPAVARDRLVRLVRDEWFDIVGLSISSERCIAGIAVCVRALRKASCNNRLLIMLGGHAIIGHEERSLFLGADMAAADAYQALEDGNALMATRWKRKATSGFVNLS